MFLKEVFVTENSLRFSVAEGCTQLTAQDCQSNGGWQVTDSGCRGAGSS